MWLTESIATWETKKSDSTRIRIKNFGPARPLANPPLGLTENMVPQDWSSYCQDWSSYCRVYLYIDGNIMIVPGNCGYPISSITIHRASGTGRAWPSVERRGGCCASPRPRKPSPPTRCSASRRLVRSQVSTKMSRWLMYLCMCV